MSDAGEAPARSDILDVTPSAHRRLVELRDRTAEVDRQGLRLRVAEVDDEHFHHDLRFDSVTRAALTDAVLTFDGLKVLIAAADVPLLEGSVIDFTPEGGIVVNNPNSPRSLRMSGVERALIDDDQIACDVRHVVAFDVNPMLQTHGGFVDFVGHDGNGTAFMTMGGGCQGCSLSAMTMRDGVRSMVAEKVPAIQRVKDVTDHAAGQRPYFTDETDAGRSAAHAHDDHSHDDHSHDHP
ncbi:MAG: NifU family protein [Acidimicrobiales bacterium]|nr:NifU family protein [Acidimicrobiales bacterium]